MTATNPLLAAKNKTVEVTPQTSPKLLGYRLKSGCSSYVFKDGSIATTAGGVILNWAGEHERELEDNVASGHMYRVFDSSEIKRNLEAISAGRETMVVDSIIPHQEAGQPDQS